MKVFRKIVIFFVVCTFSFTSMFSFSALEKQKMLIGYCTNNTEFDEYALQNADLLAGSLGLNIDRIMLGRPLTIYGYDNNNIQIYPFISNNEVVSILEVYDVDGEVGGSFSSNYVDFLNRASYLTSTNSPLYLYRNETGIYGVIDDTTQLVISNNSQVKSIPVNHERDNLDINNCFSGSNITLTRYGSRYCDWQTYFCNSSYITSCGIISLWNIFKNYGNNSFASYTNLGNDYTSKTGYISYLYTDKVQLASYFNLSNIQFTDNVYSIYYNDPNNPHPLSWDTLYMDLNQVVTMVQTNHKYGLAFSKDTNTSSNIGHITAVVGYAAGATGSYYIFFNPHGANDGLIYVDSNTRQFTSSGNVYVWNGGYLANIDISNFS